MIAMVGARNASANGRKFAAVLASGLGERGHVIVFWPRPWDRRRRPSRIDGDRDDRRPRRRHRSDLSPGASRTRRGDRRPRRDRQRDALRSCRAGHGFSPPQPNHRGPCAPRPSWSRQPSAPARSSPRGLPPRWAAKSLPFPVHRSTRAAAERTVSCAMARRSPKARTTSKRTCRRWTPCTGLHNAPHAPRSRASTSAQPRARALRKSRRRAGLRQTNRLHSGSWSCLARRRRPSTNSCVKPAPVPPTYKRRCSISNSMAAPSGIELDGRALRHPGQQVSGVAESPHPWVPSAPPQ